MLLTSIEVIEMLGKGIYMFNICGMTRWVLNDKVHLESMHHMFSM